MQSERALCKEAVGLIIKHYPVVVPRVEEIYVELWERSAPSAYWLLRLITPLTDARRWLELVIERRPRLE